MRTPDRIRRRLAGLALAMLAPLTASGQAPPDTVAPKIETSAIHWAYGSFLGTGYYRLSGEREVFIIDMPFSWTWREPDLAADGARSTGIRFEFPVTAGLHQLEVIDDLLDLDNLGTVSFTPGVRLRYPVDERWMLQGSVNAGWGTETSGEESAWIWDVEFKSRYGFQRGDLDWGLLGEVFHAGYVPDEGNSGSLGGFGAGVDFRHPVSWTTMDDGALDLTWDLTYRWYGDALTFRDGLGGETRIDDEWRVGVGLARRDRRFRVWLFSFEQIGIGYRISSGGDFRGVTVNFSLPLSR